MNEQQVREWLRGYAWLGTDDEKNREVDCIMAQGGWKFLSARADQRAGAALEPGPEAFDDAYGMELSALYECHEGPHQPTCPMRPNAEASWRAER